MRRQPILVAGLAATMLAAIPAGVLSQQPAATFRAGVDAVAVEASVRRNNRPVTGDSAWKTYEIVLDVPGDGMAIAFGVLLSGPGTVWVDDFKFERVPNTTPVTSPSVGQGQPRSPVNLDFNQ